MRSKRGYLSDELNKVKSPIFNGELKKPEDAKAWLLGIKKLFELHDYTKNIKASVITQKYALGFERGSPEVTFSNKAYRLKASPFNLERDISIHMVSNSPNLTGNSLPCLNHMMKDNLNLGYITMLRLWGICMI